MSLGWGCGGLCSAGTLLHLCLCLRLLEDGRNKAEMLGEGAGVGWPAEQVSCLNALAVCKLHKRRALCTEVVGIWQCVGLAHRALFLRKMPRRPEHTPVPPCLKKWPGSR